VGDESRLTAVAPMTGGPPIGKQRWVGSQVTTMQKNAFFKFKHEKHVASAGISASKVYGFGITRSSHCCLVDSSQILHWAVIIGAWLLNWKKGSVPSRLTRSQDSIV
jgi:hypothetical protein